MIGDKHFKLDSSLRLYTLCAWTFCPYTKTEQYVMDKANKCLLSLISYYEKTSDIFPYISKYTSRF